MHRSMIFLTAISRLKIPRLGDHTFLRIIMHHFGLRLAVLTVRAAFLRHRYPAVPMIHLDQSREYLSEYTRAHAETILARKTDAFPREKERRTFLSPFFRSEERARLPARSFARRRRIVGGPRENSACCLWSGDSLSTVQEEAAHILGACGSHYPLSSNCC